MYKIAALYKFISLKDISALRAEILNYAQKECPSMCGTLLLAPEGINGTIGAYPDEMDQMILFLDQKLDIAQGELKYSESSQTPFNRFKVRPKKEIITMRAPEADPNIVVGEYVEPEDWNDLLEDPEVTLIDTRNDYETKLGVFKDAINPNLQNFTDFKAYVEKHMDPQKNKKVAMYCTGGIRCEKASSYMMAHGFEKVYHLKGGILKYLETISADESLWEGECFVFDKRVSVSHGLKEGNWTICHGCREPLSEEETQREEYEKGVSCHHCKDTLSLERIASLRMRQKHYNERYGQ